MSQQQEEYNAKKGGLAEYLKSDPTQLCTVCISVLGLLFQEQIELGKYSGAYVWAVSITAVQSILVLRKGFAFRGLRRHINERMQRTPRQMKQGERKIVL